ncbi:MAG: universal stress protein [Cyclobacteriaceae bacterium]
MLYPLKRLLICLDLTEMDDVLIRYTALFAKKMNVEKLYFIHVAKSLEIPEALKKEFPEMDTPLDETLIDQIKPKIKEHINTDEIEYQIGIKDGNVTENILKWSKIKQIDLIVMGRKKPDDGTGANPSRIANISLCSVLIVPNNPAPTLKHVFVAIDFSSYANRAVARALEFKEKCGADVTLQNVYRVPKGYHYTGKTYKEFAKIMKDNSQKDLDVFVKKYDLDPSAFDYVTTLDDDDKPADKIFVEASRCGADLIMVGSRGRTTAASLLLGSVAVALLRYNFTTPFFIVKNKDQNLGFFQALMRI